MRAIEAVTAKGETSALCQSIDVSRASLYRRRRPTPPATPRRPRAPSPRALVPAERRAVRDTLHSARFVDQSPAEVYATLLEEQTYLCSPRTMYRVLAEADEVRERRDQVRHPAYVKPELIATAPNQVWSWDITKLKGPVPYLYYSLYVILDLFSRYVVGWMVAVKESAHLAECLIEQTCATQRIQPQQLTIHADRGAPMRSKLVALLFSDAAPTLRDAFGIGADSAAEMMIVAGDNPTRVRSEAAFAKLCGACPIPASSGVTHRHRLFRGGHRQANAAIYRIVTVRMRWHQPTLDYVGRRTAQGLTKKDIIRCLKRFVAREIYNALIADHRSREALTSAA